MISNSIRWRLTFSFAAIALLAAFALGAALLFILQNYYAAREQNYLRANAQAIGILLRDSRNQNLDAAEI